MKKELHADPRVVLEGNFSFRKYLPATFYAPGEGFSHEMRYQAEHDRAEVCKSETGREPASVRTPLKACTPILKTAPRKLMTYPIYFQMRKYVTNLYLHGTEVTRSFAAFGGSCAPEYIYLYRPPSLYIHNYTSLICNKKLHFLTRGSEGGKEERRKEGRKGGRKKGRKGGSEGGKKEGGNEGREGGKEGGNEGQKGSEGGWEAARKAKGRWKWEGRVGPMEEGSVDDGPMAMYIAVDF